ncbi:GGDEF domain-containing protein, partial [Actinoplanes philippinensis]|uniref:GGDEF domain-containing protein n=1 Tax=Actinoplanes philippinensis TaxID=35752 RepID=UPI0033E2B43C
LIAVAELLADEQDRLAADGFTARMGGEEFLMVLPGVTAAEAFERLDAVRRLIAGHRWQPVTGELPVTISVGAVATGLANRDRAQLLAEADRRLYTAKREGRNRVVS